MDKDLRRILDAVEDAGYTVEFSTRGTALVFTKDGEYVTSFAGNASDWRARRNALSPLKRRGFRWPPKR